MTNPLPAGAMIPISVHMEAIDAPIAASMALPPASATAAPAFAARPVAEAIWTLRMSEQASAVSAAVRGVDVEPGALGARTQDEGAGNAALKTVTPRAASLADRTTYVLMDAALCRHRGSHLR